MSRDLIALGLAFVLLAPVAARADWLPEGTPVAAWSGEQLWPFVTSDGHGGSLVAWSESGGAMAQHLTRDGDASVGWPATGLPLPPMSRWDVNNGIHSAQPVPDGDGGFYAVTSASGECIAHCGADPACFYVQRLTSRGATHSGWPANGVQIEYRLLRRFDFQSAHAIAAGRFGVIVEWLDTELTDAGLWEPTLYVQVVSPDGSPRWGRNGIVVARGAGILDEVAVTSDHEGGALVFWGKTTSLGDIQVIGQHIDRPGRLVWTSEGRRLSEVKMSTLKGPVATSVRDGGAIVAWVCGTIGSSEVRAVQVTTSGRAAWGRQVRLCVGSAEQDAPEITSDGEEGAIVAWRDARSGQLSEVFMQRVSRMGRLEWGPTGARAGSFLGDGKLALASDGRAGAFVAWGGARSDGRLFATHLDRHAHLESGWDADGTVISKWHEFNIGFGLSADSPWLVSTSRDEATLVWESWQPISLNGIQGYADQSFVMLLRGDGPAARPNVFPKPRTAEPVRLVASAIPPAFALRGIRPNPAPSSAIVSFALPDPRPASLEMFDVTGRRVWSRSVGDLGPGEHDVRLRDGAWSPPGVYLVRLTQGERAATARVVIVK